MRNGTKAAQKVVLFAPINAAGHMQSSLAIADKLRCDYNYKCVFVFAGPPHTNIVEDHGHELIIVEDVAPLEDFEVESDDDLSRPMDEASKELKRRQGKTLRKFAGASRWPQFVARHRDMYNVESEEARIGIVHLIRVMSKWMMAVNELIDREIERIKPDLIVADTVLLQPSIIKEQDTRPWVRLFTPNPLNVVQSKLPNGAKPPIYLGLAIHSKEERARMRAEEPERWRAMLDKWTELNDRYVQDLEESINAIRGYYHANGCAVELTRDFHFSSPHLNIYMYPEALDYDQEDDLLEYPPRWLRCDSLVRNADGKQETIETERWAKLIDERKQRFKSIVYFSLGSIASGSPDLMQRYVKYLSEDDGQTLYIVSKGVNGDKVQLDPKNMLGGNYLPQTYLLQRSDLAVIHGGNNSLTESLYYGKPVLVLPGFGDQQDNAQRIEDLKLGKRLNLYKCTKDEFLSAIKNTLADRDLIDRARKIGERMRSRDELGKVTSLLKDIAETGHLDNKLAIKLGIRIE